MLVAGGTGLRGYEAHFSMRAGAAKALSSDPLITHEKFVHHSDSAKICRQRAAGKTPYTRILRTNNYLRLNFLFVKGNAVRYKRDVCTEAIFNSVLAGNYH